MAERLSTQHRLFKGEVYHLDGHATTLERRLGEGSEGVMYSANVHLSGKESTRYALKVANKAGDDQNFARETEILEGKDIKGAQWGMGPFEFNDGKSKWYYATIQPEIQGQSLDREYRQMNRKPTANEVASDMGQVARTLHSAHNEGIVHMDIKPANTMRSSDGKVTVIDWGTAAKDGDVQTLSIGTPFYQAPETASVNDYLARPKMDTYSAGRMGEFLANGTYGRKFSPEADFSTPQGTVKALDEIRNDRTVAQTDDFILNAAFKRATNPNPAERGSSLDLMTDLAAFPGARQHYDQDDLNAVANHVIKRVSNYETRNIIVDAAVARGVVEDLSADSPLRDRLSKIGAMAAPPATAQEVKAQRESTRQMQAEMPTMQIAQPRKIRS